MPLQLMDGNLGKMRSFRPRTSMDGDQKVRRVRIELTTLGL